MITTEERAQKKGQYLKPVFSPDDDRLVPEMISCAENALPSMMVSLSVIFFCWLLFTAWGPFQ